ncbi:MAG TPA: hypothetical protein VGO52_13180 [Hyphomonadaceae bacterium]|nr:hypothetical protein [Hyphomonadaceae bacterium]
MRGLVEIDLGRLQEPLELLGAALGQPLDVREPERAGFEPGEQLGEGARAAALQGQLARALPAGLRQAKERPRLLVDDDVDAALRSSSMRSKVGKPDGSSGLASSQAGHLGSER